MRHSAEEVQFQTYRRGTGTVGSVTRYPHYRRSLPESRVRHPPNPPNDRVRIALIGASGQGSDDARTALDTGGVEMESKSYGVHVII